MAMGGVAPGRCEVGRFWRRVTSDRVWSVESMAIMRWEEGLEAEEVPKRRMRVWS